MENINNIEKRLLEWLNNEEIDNISYIKNDGVEIYLKDDLWIILNLINTYKWLKTCIENFMNLQWSEIEILIAKAKAYEMEDIFKNNKN